MSNESSDDSLRVYFQKTHRGSNSAHVQNSLRLQQHIHNTATDRKRRGRDTAHTEKHFEE